MMKKLNQPDQQKLNILNRLVEHYGKQHWWENENWVYDGVSMILIQQSTQENVMKALANLEPHLSISGLSALSDEELQACIRPSGFYQQKCRYLRSWLAFFAENGEDLTAYQSIETAELRKMLLSITGVGLETADCMLMYLFQRKIFIADAYARRLFARLGFEYEDYAQMHADFQHLTDHATLEQCKEWHACIDVHGKYVRKGESVSERALFEGEILFVPVQFKVKISSLKS